jgi:anaerobic magnesium-protoporphyrin IX monomethyl ester cyclase
VTSVRVVWPVYNLEREYSQYPGIMSIAALLRQYGFESEIVPATDSEVTACLRTHPRVVLAFTTPTPYARHYMNLNLRIKKSLPDVMSVFGGPHPTFFPEMIDEPGVDGVCIGEGEHAMVDFVRRYAEGGALGDIPNWWFRKDGAIQRNDVRPLIQDLDELPVPDHGIFRRAMSPSVTQAVVMTCRGCPGQCTYCFNHAYRRLYAGKGHMIRRRSVDHVMEELLQVKVMGYEYIRFMDDVFILSPPWIAEFSEKYRRKIGLPFTCLARAEFVKPDVCRMLKEAGCYRMLLGIEAGNDRVRQEIMKRPMTKEILVHAARTIRGAGLKLTTANILGVPGGSFDADWETLELNLKCKPHYASVSLLQAYPRTEMYDIAMSMDMLRDEHVTTTEQSYGFGLTSGLKFSDPRERRRIENLHKFFPWAVWFPRLIPLIRLLIRLPSNKLYDAIYFASTNIGMHLLALPPRIGLPILLRKTGLLGVFRRHEKGKIRT